MKKRFSVVAIASIAAASHAQSVAPAAQPWKEAEPLRVLRLGLDLRPAGGWVEYAAGSTREGCAGLLAFDSLNNTSGDGCPMPAGTTGSSHVVNDFTLASGAGGGAADAITLLWQWDASEQCYLGIVILDDFDASCGGPAASNPLGGIVFDFGWMPTGSWNMKADLCSVGGPPLPEDGSGAYRLFMSNHYNGDDFVLTSKGRWLLGDTRGVGVGSQGPIQWEDGNLDGEFGAGECVDYSNADPCLDGLGAAIVIHTTAAACPGDFNGDTVVNSLDFVAFLNAYVSSDPEADFNGDTVVNSLDFVAFLNAFAAGC